MQFGDGERGARLPTGSNNVRAKYRKGIGAGGNVKAGALAQLLDRPLGVKGVEQPGRRERRRRPGDRRRRRARRSRSACARSAAPSRCSTTRTTRARSPASSKANATVLPLRGGRTIVVTVAFEGGERLADLADALRTHGDPRVQVLVLEGTTETFRLGLTVAVDPAYERGRGARRRRGGAPRGVLVRGARADRARVPVGDRRRRAHGRRRPRRRRRPPLHRHDRRPRRPPARAAARRRRRPATRSPPACSCSIPRRSTELEAMAP